VRIGVVMLPTDPWARSVARAQHLDTLGFDHLWTYDHLSWQRYRDQDWHAAIPWLTGIAAATSHVRLGTLVTSPNFRHPVTLAKEAMTLDHISAGRLTLGVGAGGTGFDATVFGDQPLSPRARADRLEAFVEVLDGLLRTPEYSVENSHYRVHEAQMIPGCVQRPRLPLAVAAAGPRTIATAVRYGDAWVTFGDPASSDPTVAGMDAAVRSQSSLVDRTCEQLGRDPASLDRIFLSGNDPRRPLTSLDAFADFVAWAQDVGFTDVVVHDPRPDDPVWDQDPLILDEIAAAFLSS
jgi:alkanesulfonate monooxygenase SsuD/methylene tetrahydromethanopterin reductase-like flavin-dependent oxidoreductase (luciferase family)